MSRIGRKPIPLAKGVNVEINGSDVVVKGAKGTLTRSFHPDMTIELEDNTLHVSRPSDSRQHRALHGLTRALLNNMVVGVSTGFTRRLSVEGVGYRAEMKGKTLVLHVGYSHPVVIEPPANLAFEVDGRGKQVTISGVDKELVGETAAQVRKVRPPEPYKGKGIAYEGEHIRRKAGKTGKV
ncbi:MAG: 50S ribosomal protein L6 [Chloroflexi bacterium]|nr:50S ribosomal protein L6 [Chloroflexota bacterium]MCI0580483.1 50S ribosomal protein L6 [Chloroflexota bacterium]MCI0649227.1 50S ribosomal protein L6 [Chloroflexota bacterium]MCI0727961.1 50S ribosomal protein L6 [Chloroflexota bacterium]